MSKLAEKPTGKTPLRTKYSGVVEQVGALWHRYKLSAVFACVMVVSSIAFFAVTSEMLEGEVQEIDHFLLLALRSSANTNVPIGPEWLHSAMHDISALGGMAVLVILTLGLSGFFVLRKQTRMLAFFVCSILGGSAAMLLLKSFFARPRPDVVPFLTTVDTASYPSGHSMLSAIVYLTLGVMLAQATSSRWLKAYYLIIPCILVGLIGFSRVYLGVHFPSDVLAGWAAGVTWASGSYLLVELLQQRNVVEDEK